ncbi:hypothetical protein [Luteimonas terrae]|uniref:Peptidoglycan-binding protein n=1 Tax=Luteimonas terrae TaxID=1530191 RepID=A0ABU1XVA9_9GAMM|nr:hypothetical protein [Luteimonas terrae]MDR7192705.1 hypothetical protein [Luteimonas terrae]
MAELKMFDVIGSFQQGQRHGTQQRLVREGEQRRNALADLTSRAYAAPVDQRQGFVSQAAAIDAEGGHSLNQQLAYDDDRRNRTLANMARMLTSAPEQARPALYQRMSAQFGQMGMQGFPTAYTPETKALIDGTAQSIVQAYSGASGEAPSQQRYAEWLLSQVPEGDRDQALGVLAGTRARPATGGYGFDEIEGADGRKRLRRTNPRSGVLEIYDESTGEFMPVGGVPGQSNNQGAPPQPGLYNTPNGQVRIGADLSPGDWELIQADMANDGASNSYQLPTRDLSPQQFNGGGSGLAVSQSSAERVAAEALARRGAENSAPALPSGYRYTAAGDMERIPGGPADISAVPSKPLPPSILRMRRESREALSVAEGLGSDIAGIAGKLRRGEIKLGPLNNLTYRGLNAAGASSSESRAFQSMVSTFEKMRNDSLRLNNGVQTEGDAQRAWAELLGNLNDNENVIEQLSRIQDINQRAIQVHMENMDEIDAEYGAQGAPGRQQGPAQGSVEDGYRFRGGDPSDPSNWERL